MGSRASGNAMQACMVHFKLRPGMDPIQLSAILSSTAHRPPPATCTACEGLVCPWPLRAAQMLRTERDVRIGPGMHAQWALRRVGRSGMSPTLLNSSAWALGRRQHRCASGPWRCLRPMQPSGSCHAYRCHDTPMLSEVGDMPRVKGGAGRDAAGCMVLRSPKSMQQALTTSLYPICFGV